MTLATYKPIRVKYIDWAIEYSPVTDKLIKIKQIYLFTGASAEEWLELAGRFAEDGGRANHTFCMMERRKCLIANGTISEPVLNAWGIEEAAEIQPLDLPELPDEIFDWQKENP